jgi:hypothetical protein
VTVNHEHKEGREMLASDLETLKSFLIDCCKDVFGTYGLVLELQEGRPFQGASDQVGTFIGFMGPSFRGTLTMFAPTSFMKATYPLGTDDGREDLQLFDWSSELANQLLGRLKNKLVARGVEIEMSLPKTVRVTQVFMASSGPKSVCGLTFTNGTDDMGVFFDGATSGDGSLFQGSYHPSRVCLPEGDLMIF